MKKVWLLIAQGDGPGEPQTIEEAYDNEGLANDALKAKHKDCCDLHWLQEVDVVTSDESDHQ